MKTIAIVIFVLAGSFAAHAQKPGDDVFDLACAITGAAEIGSTKEGSTERNTAFRLWSFYLGRLSGRDNETKWGAMVKRELAKMGNDAKSARMFDACAQFFAEKLK